jgi:replication-associated recombination protein RarA
MKGATNMPLDTLQKEVLWVERYRPRLIEDTILPQRTKDTFKKFVSDGTVPNLLLAGGPGVGKTTIAKAMLNELDCDYIVKNGSLNVASTLYVMRSRASRLRSL